jgi:hypothetical protein
MQQGSFQSPKDNNTQTQANSVTFQYPQAYNTQTRMNTGQFQQSPYGYYGYPDIPPPPPPPVNKHKQYTILISIFVALGLVIGGSVIGVIATHQFSQTLGQTQAELHPTPTQDIAIGLVSSDFPTFLRAFATAMAAKDYSAIQKSTDTQNFQYIPLLADGTLSWNQTYDELTTGNLSAVLQYPPITPAQEGYCHYTQNGLPQILSVNGASLEYDVGTLSGNAIGSSMQANLNGTVFAFESAEGGIWLWRAIVTNNTPC